MLPLFWTNRNSLLESSFSDLYETFSNGFPSHDKETDVLWKPSVDVHETEKDVTLDVELPGLNKENIKIDIKDDILTVSGERSHTEETKEKNYTKTERLFGKFERSFYLPKNVNSDKISASYKDGLLILTIPKSEKAIHKEIPISVN